MSKLGKFAAASAAVLCAFGAGEVRAADQELADGGDLAAAVAQANDGDTITLGEGNYACVSLSVTKAITIRGAGAKSVLAAGANATAITLNNAGAVLEDVGFSGTKASGFINVAAGTCRRVTVAGITEQGKVFNVTGADAVLDDCCATNIFRNWAGQGYILCQSAGLVKNSRFVDMYGPDEAVNITGGTISNCLIKGTIDNYRTGAQAGNGQTFAALKVNGSNALVTHSRIVENGKLNSARYGTILLSAGTVRNCLIADNVVQSYGAVALSGSGRLENCTVVGTIRNNASQNGLSLHMTGGTAVNNIFDDGERGSASVYVSSGTFATNLVPVAVSTGVGNKVGVPFFLDPEAGDYTPGICSEAVNAGALLPWMTEGATDVRGADRVMGDAPDMGAFEGQYGEDGPLSCGFKVANNQFRVDAADKTVVFSASVAGQGADGATVAWYVDDGAEPVGTGLVLETDALPVGLHTVKLVVTPTDGSIAPIEHELQNCVLIYPKRMYVDAENATPESPYETPAKAAKTLADVIDFLMPASTALPGYPEGEDAVVTVEVADGTYRLSDLVLSVPVRFVAKSGAAPVLDINKVDPGITFSDGRQVLDGFTVVNGRTHALRFYSGSCMRNCTVQNLQNVVGGTSACFILVSGSMVSNCVFRGAISAYAYSDPVVQLSGSSLVSDCLFENMENLDTVAYVDGEESVMSNCIFRNSPMTSVGGNLRYQAITLSAGLVTHCVITNFGGTGSTGRGNKSYGGVVSVIGAKATLRNCLIADCSAKENAGIDIQNGAVENCTVVGGTLAASASGSQRNLKQTGGRVVNSIFWNDQNIDGVTLSGGTFEYSWSLTKKAGETNKGGDPALDADFVPTSLSLARDCGAALDWITEGSVDLRGSNRVVNAVVDMGAFEGDELEAELLLTLETAFSRLDGEKVVYTATPDAKIGYDPVVNPEFVWTLDGEAAGTSSGAKEFALLPRSAPYVVVCSVSDGKQTKTAEVSLPVHNGVFYVSPDGSNEAPYDSWEKAAKTLDTILAIDHPQDDTRTFTVHFSSGNHSTCGFNLTTAIAIVGEDGAIFNSGNAPVFSHAGCSISNFVFSGLGFSLNNGVARDVVVRNRSNQSGDTLVTIRGGVCDGLVMTNCRTTAWNWQYGVSVSGSARLSNFQIDNCAGYDKLLAVSGSAVVSNGTIKSSNGVLGGGQGNTREYLISAEGGVVSHVMVTDCGDKRDKSSWSSRDGTVRVSGGTVRNCLIVGNRSTDCAGVNLSGGHLESCTVVVNDGDVLHQTYGGTYGSCLNMTGGFATNCVFYSTEATSGDWNYCRVTGGKIGNCWLSVKGKDTTPAGTGVLVGDDPCFTSRGGWDYVPAGGSPLIGKGLNQPWMTGATDFAGKKRVCARRVDLGAFEGDAPGLMLIVR